MGLISTPVILKIVCLVVLFIVTVIGCNAHFNNDFKTQVWDTKGFPEACKRVYGNKCPSSAIAMERIFVAFTIIFLLLTGLSVILSFFIDFKKIRIPDAILYAAAGLLVFISGILIIIAAVKIDDFVRNVIIGGAGVKSTDTEHFEVQRLVKERFELRANDLKTQLRKEAKYYDKLAAGVLGLLNGILIFATSASIFRSSK